MFWVRYRYLGKDEDDTVLRLDRFRAIARGLEPYLCQKFWRSGKDICPVSASNGHRST